ncbi:Uncharacterized protein PHSC3_001626 [Chlamydiales bacterium STE3]|nr:Uncharacterized protein PHSC3_001626 [Chlamydiales bacterium STE3]
MLTKNLSRNGRILRLAIASILLTYAIWQSSWIALIFALFTLFETFMSWCVLYQILGINECPVEPRDPKP